MISLKIEDCIDEQLNKLKKLLASSTTDLLWSKYDSIDEIFDVLDLLEIGIKKRNEDSLKKMILLLAPTGDLQEISISSGWEDEFIDIANTLENEIRKKNRAGEI